MWLSRRFSKCPSRKTEKPLGFVGLGHIDDKIKKRNCKFMNSLVAHHFDLDVMQLAFSELSTFSF